MDLFVKSSSSIFIFFLHKSLTSANVAAFMLGTSFVLSASHYYHDDDDYCYYHCQTDADYHYKEGSSVTVTVSDTITCCAS